MCQERTELLLDLFLSLALRLSSLRMDDNWCSDWPFIQSWRRRRRSRRAKKRTGGTEGWATGRVRVSMHL